MRAANLSAYEQRRLRNVARNNAMFGELGLDAAVNEKQQLQPTAQKQRKRKESNTAVPPPRRSSRTRGAAPQYTGERIDRFGESDDDDSYDDESEGEGGGTKERRREAVLRKEQRRKQNDVAEMLKASAEWLRDSRAALLGQLSACGSSGNSSSSTSSSSIAVAIKTEPGVGSAVKMEPGASNGSCTAAAETSAMLRMYNAAGTQAAQAATAPAAGTPAYFRQEAVRRWGERVPAADTVGADWDWEAYLLSRLSTPPPPAPPGVALLQERFCGCCWRLLVSCTLMSRVSSAAVKDVALPAFFARYPTPTAALEADPPDVLKILAPLGLFPNRMRSVVEVSRCFLAMPRFDVGLKPPLKIYGIGEFGLDSFLIFCRDRGATLVPADRNLAGYCRWRKQIAAAEPAIDKASNGAEPKSKQQKRNKRPLAPKSTGSDKRSRARGSSSE